MCYKCFIAGHVTSDQSYPATSFQKTRIACSDQEAETGVKNGSAFCGGQVSDAAEASIRAEAVSNNTKSSCLE